MTRSLIFFKTGKKIFSEKQKNPHSTTPFSFQIGTTPIQVGTKKIQVGTNENSSRHNRKFKLAQLKIGVDTNGNASWHINKTCGSFLVMV